MLVVEHALNFVETRDMHARIQRAVTLDLFLRGVFDNISINARCLASTKLDLHNVAFVQINNVHDRFMDGSMCTNCDIVVQMATKELKLSPQVGLQSLEHRLR